jgi:hypothetical protein
MAVGCIVTVYVSQCVRAWLVEYVSNLHLNLFKQNKVKRLIQHLSRPDSLVAGVRVIPAACHDPVRIAGEAFQGVILHPASG